VAAVGVAVVVVAVVAVVIVVRIRTLSESRVVWSHLLEVLGRVRYQATVKLETGATPTFSRVPCDRGPHVPWKGGRLNNVANLLE